jgi:hypothetical protein
METLYIDFSDSASLSGRLKFLGITTAFIGLIGSIICITNKTFDFFFYTQVFLFIYGLFMLTPYPYRISTKNKPFFKVDENSIEFRTTPFSQPKKENWNEVTGIIIKPRMMILETTSGKKVRINLNWISRKNIMVIAQSIKEFATSKGIKIFLFSA